MTIEETKKWFGRAAPIILGVLVISGLGFLIYSFLNRDNPIYGKLPKQVFQNELSRPTTWNLNDLEVTKPNNAPVYKINNRKVSRSQASTLAVKLGLPAGGLITRDSQKREQFSVRLGTSELFVDLYSGEVHFKKNVNTNSPLANSVVEEKKALSTALKTIKKLGIETTLYDINQPSFNYFQVSKNSEHLVSVAKTKANLVYISFPMKVNDLAVVTTGGPEFLSLGIDSQDELFSVDFSKIEVGPDEQATYRLITEVNQSLVSGKGKLDHYTSGESNLQNPNLIRVGQGKLVLYNDNQTNYLQPILVFEVNASNNQIALPAEVYLPLVAEN